MKNGGGHLDVRLHVTYPVLLLLMIQVSHHLIEWSVKHDSIEQDRNELRGDAMALVIAGRSVGDS